MEGKQDRNEIVDTGNDISNVMVSPPTTDTSPKPMINESVNETKGGKTSLKFSSSDVIQIIFFSGAIVAFVLSIRYFRNRRDVLLRWQKDANDELITIKGKIKNIEDKITKKQTAQPNV